MKKITFGLLFSLLSLFTCFAQVQVGSGNNLNQNVPFNTTKAYSYGQSIYLSSEINAVGTITSLQWYFDGASPLTNNQALVIYLGTTAKTNFTSSTDWIASTGLTQVYTGGITTDSAPGWKTITLSTPFVYDGTSNLVVAVDENTPGFDGTSFKFRNFNTSETRSISYGNNSTNPDALSPPTSGASSLSATNFVPNIIFGGLMQTCLTPLNIAFTSINETSFVINWENQGAVPASGSEIYISTNSTLPVPGTLSSFTVPTGVNTFTVTGLTPLTTYYLWIKSVCSGTEVSAFSELGTVLTSAVPVTAFFESFESVTIPSLPLGWSKIVRGPSLATTADVKSATTNINITSQSVVFSSGASTMADDIMLVSTPVSNIAAANNRLKLYARGSGAIQVGTLSTNDENAVFTNVEEIILTNTTALYQVDFDYAISTDSFIGIRLVTTGSSIATYVDDIRWEAIPNCSDVTSITVPVVASTTATINWISNTGSENAWNIAIAPTSTLTPEGLPFFTSTNGGLYNATDLLEDTAYKVWVRSVCGADNGAWIGPVLFRTDCTAVAAFTENFDTTPALTLPTCWGRILRGESLSTNANVRAIASNANSGTMSLQLSNSSSTGEFDVIAVSPRLSSLALGTYRIKFFAKGAGILQLGTVDNATNAGTFISLNSVTTTAAYAEYVVDFTAYTGIDTHFGIRLASTTANSTVYIDDVIWELAPLCADVTAISVDNISEESANINWAESIGTDSWNIAIGSSLDTDPTTLPFFTSTTSGSYTATDLENNTSYKVWVRSVCGTNLGAWIGPVAFQTNCAPGNVFTENFDTTTTPALPGCWSKIIYGPTVSTSATVTTSTLASGQSSPNVVRLFNAGSTGVYDIMLVSPYLNDNVISGSRIKFYAKSLTEDGVLEIVTMSSNTPGTPFNSILTIPLTNTMAEYIVNLDGSSTTDSFVGFRLNATEGYKTLYVDNITLEPIPTCLDVSDINVSDLTTTSATLTWTANGSESAWNVAIGANTVTDPNTLTALSSSNNSYFLTDLTPATYYNVWVQSVCSSENGAWIGPLTFSTSCNAVTTLNENFNSTSFFELPLCWNSIVRNGASANSAVVVQSGGVASTNGLTIYADNSPAGVDVILVTPNLSNMATGNQILTFVASGSNSLEIGTLNANTSFDSVFTPFQTVPLTESNQTITVNFASYTGIDTYIGFKIVTGSTSTSSQYIGLDNIVWETNLSNEDFDASKALVYPNPVQDILNIKTTKELTSVTVYNVMGQEVLSTSHNLSQIDMSSLSNGAYLVKLNGTTFTETLKVIKN